MQSNLKRNLKQDKMLQKKQIISHQVTKTINPQRQSNPYNPYNEGGTDFQIQYIDPVNQIIKAKQWWQNLDKTYFKGMKLKDILFMRDLTSSQKLINFFNNQGELQGSFQNEEIFSKYPQLQQNSLIRVLFKSSNPFITQLLSFSFANYIQLLNKRATKATKEQNIQSDTIQGYKVSCLKKISSLENRLDLSSEQLQQTLKNGNLQLDSTLHNDSLLSKIERVEQTKLKMKFDQDVNIQLQLWKQEALRQNSKNSIFWDNLLSSFSRNVETQSQNFQTQVFSIKQQLMHHTILRYMEHGTKDKTNLMLKQLLENMKQLKPAKTRESTTKKFFETDCKICFCSFNYDSNQVLYCDMCNTSFHLACYGLHEVPQQKEYFCDRCTMIKKEENAKSISRKIICQICFKPNFPMKQIDGHFYHMTCLILLNLITIKQGKIQLREGLNHKTIISKIIQAQLESRRCIFCPFGPGGDSGIQFRCSFEGCQSSMHPICAYINGCKFDIKRNMREKNIEVNILCNQHDCDRDYIQQTYLRRYMCNFKNTSQKSLQSFRNEYSAQILSRQPKLNQRIHSDSQLPNIIIDTKVIRKHISNKQHKKIENNEEITNTETRKIFQKLIKNKL